MANTTTTKTRKQGIKLNLTTTKWLEICEYYSNHTAHDTIAHFNIDMSTGAMSKAYKRLGFLPKSAARNPNLDRVRVVKPMAKGRFNILVKRGGYIMNGKVMSTTEFAKVRKQLKVGDTFKTITVTEHKVGIIDA
jgi:hypothetical protein